jgi:hypothetical protein
MPGFASRDDIISEITTLGKVDDWSFVKTAPANGLAGVWQSLWLGAGNPATGAAPAGTPGIAYNSDQTANVNGTMWFPDRDTDQRYLLSLGAAATQNCTLMLYDRLTGVGGIALSSTGTKTANTVALPRYSGTDAIGNEAWLEVTTATTTTAPVVNLNSYTTADGTTGQVGGSVTFPAAATVIHSMIHLPQTPGKRGVRSVEAGLNVGTAAAAGVANLIIIKPLARIPLLANVWNQVSFLDDVLTLPRIYDNAALGLALLCTTTTAVTVWGSINCAYG